MSSTPETQPPTAEGMLRSLLHHAAAPKNWLEPGKRWLTAQVFLAFLGAPLLVLKFLVVPQVLSRAVAIYAEGHGIEMEVEDWSAEILDLTATAHGVVVFASGSYEQKEFFKADSFELDLSLWGGLSGRGWVRALRVREPEIYLERQLAGHWNWQDVMTGNAAPGVDGADGGDHGSRFRLPRLEIENMALAWTENLPAGSRGGLIQTLQATLHLDDVSASATDLAGLVDLRPQPSKFTLEARTGEGRISLDSRANFFSWSEPEQSGPAQAASRGPVWAPALETKIVLENVGAGVLSRLMPDAAIVPESGNMTGTVELRLAKRAVSCQASLDMRDVTFAVNPSSPLAARRSDRLNADLASYRANGPRQFDCSGVLASEDYRPFQAFQTNVTRTAVDRAPRTVRAVAAAEHSRYSDQPVERDVAADVDRMLRDLDPQIRSWMNLAETVSRYTGGQGPGGSSGFLRKLKRPFGP